MRAKMALQKYKKIIFILLAVLFLGVLSIIVFSPVYFLNICGRRTIIGDIFAQFKRKNINEEIKQLGEEHSWAGAYYEGDGLGRNVSLLVAPSSGFLYELVGCVGLYDWNYGGVTVQDGHIKLQCELDKPNRILGGGIDVDFFQIQWGDRHYLVPESKMLDFCRDVDEGWEPRGGGHGLYLLRGYDHNKEVTGLPELPEKYSKYLDMIGTEGPNGQRILPPFEYRRHGIGQDWLRLYWVKCTNADCAHEWRMDKTEYYTYLKEHQDPMSVAPPGIVCPECGREQGYRAERCEKCWIVFVRGSVPHDFADRCPECKHSRVERKRKEARETNK